MNPVGELTYLAIDTGAGSDRPRCKNRDNRAEGTA